MSASTVPAIYKSKKNMSDSLEIFDLHSNMFNV